MWICTIPMLIAAMGSEETTNGGGFDLIYNLMEMTKNPKFSPAVWTNSLWFDVTAPIKLSSAVRLCCRRALPHLFGTLATCLFPLRPRFPYATPQDLQPSMALLFANFLSSDSLSKASASRCHSPSFRGSHIFRTYKKLGTV